MVATSYPDILHEFLLARCVCELSPHEEIEFSDRLERAWNLLSPEQQEQHRRAPCATWALSDLGLVDTDLSDRCLPPRVKDSLPLRT